MADVVVRTPMQYLDRALTTLRDMGIVPAKGEDAPINALLQKISDLDQDRITVIARTLNQASNFNEIVREHVSAMQVGDRYRQITEGFNSIRDDAKAMVDQISDGKVSVWERATNSWMKLTRGDVA
ncbi:MAG: cell surface protein, partial [Alphaproteobacteria bacterium]|nr:cell surface protein [Alphaproteobacteria bacterium]